jgi:hypothetical protein
MPVFTVSIGYLITNNEMFFGKTNDADLYFSIRIEATVDTSEFDQEKALAMLREEIKGKEDQPASEVFKNIKMMKQVPAGRLLRIMEFGFSRSLGVTCTHCHNPNNFADEDKRQKQITRDMMEMASKINNELIPAIENLDSEKPMINCTTCHRGEVKPALNLENE